MGTGWKNEKGLAKDHICTTHRHRQQCGDSQREGGQGLGKGEQRGRQRGNGDICHSVNKIKLKNKN